MVKLCPRSGNVNTRTRNSELTHRISGRIGRACCHQCSPDRAGSGEAASRASFGGGGVGLARLENSSGSWLQAPMFLDSQVPIFVMRTPAVPERLRTETLTKRFPVRPQSISMSA